MMARSVNTVWNFVRETQDTALKRKNARILPNGKSIPNFFSMPELCKLTAGSSKILGVHSKTIQAVVEQYVDRRQQFKKASLKWRGKRSLGWIPFANNAVKIRDDEIVYFGHTFRLWLSRELKGKVLCGGCFSQDARGRWYVNIVTDYKDESVKAGEGEVGVDLGLKTLATLSNGKKYSSMRYYRRQERLLKLAQKDGKTKRVKNIGAKIKNARKDNNHKISHELTRDNNLIIVGGVPSSVMTKTRMAKSVNDAGWYQLRTFIEYKAIARGSTYLKVNEAFTSQTCNCCGARSPAGAPAGVKSLGIRKWVCGVCNAVHDRDINAALNIFRLGCQALGLKWPRSLETEDIKGGFLQLVCGRG